MRPSQVFILLSVMGVAEAFYHAWQENAFTTNWFAVKFTGYASLMGIPYWAFGIVWYPLVLVIGLWTTSLGRKKLRKELLVILSVGNVFTVYLWDLDFFVVVAFTAAYVGLYVTNYALTSLVIAENWSSPEMRDFSLGTVIGMVVGAFFGSFGVAALGITGGIFGAIGGYTSTR